MSTTRINSQFQRILEVVEKKKGLATKSDIKCSIHYFNQGKSDELEKALTAMVDQGILCEHLHKAGNGQEVKFYRPCKGHNSIHANHTDADISLSASVHLTNGGRDLAKELTREGVKLLASLINAGGLVQSPPAPFGIDKNPRDIRQPLPLRLLFSVDSRTVINFRK